jgi:hypothetical protein
MARRARALGEPGLDVTVEPTVEERPFRAAFLARAEGPCV